jgi:DNA polymerase-4
VFAIFHRFTPLVEGLSLDEAFLDVTASRSLYGDGATIAAMIKKAIRDEVSLNASAGVAPCKFVAKIASDLEKPDGLCVIREEEIPTVLWPLPIERMWGIGPKSAPRAHAAGFHTLGDLARADPAKLERAFGDWGPEMARLARGEDTRDVEPGRDAKSVGAEETFDRDLHTHEEIAAKLLAQSARVASRLFADGTAGRGVTVKLKYADFTIKTRAMQLPEAVCDTRSIFRAARTLLDRFELRGRGVRLSGVSVSALAPIDHVRTLFPDPEIARSTKIEAALASLRDRFGSKVRPATLLGEGRDGERDE